MAWMKMTALALVLVGCGDPGSDSADGGSESSPETSADSDAQTSADTGMGDWNCGMHVLESLEDDCEGLGSAQQLLDVATVEQMSQLAWSTYESEEVTHTPADGTTALTLRLAYDGGEARCFHYCDPCPGQPCGAAGQPARIEVDALAEVSTADGALAESWPVVAEGLASVTQAGFTGSVAATSVTGTLTVELLDPAYEELEVGISGVLADGSSSGALNILARVPDPTGPAITVPLASWPAP